MKGGIIQLLTFAFFLCYISLSAAQQEIQIVQIVDGSPESNIKGVFLSGVDAYIHTDSSAHIYHLSNVTGELLVENLTPIPVDTAATTIQTGVFDPEKMTAYIGGADYLYRVLLTGYQNVTKINAPDVNGQLFASSASFIDVSRRVVYFITNTQYIVYFSISDPSGFNTTKILSPDPANNKPPQYFPIASSGVFSAAYNESNQMLYMVSGQLEKFDINTTTTVGTAMFDAGSSQYIEIEPTSQTIWVCVDVPASDATHVTTVFIYDTNLNVLDSIPFSKGDVCQGMQFDSERGSVIIAMNSAGLIYRQYSITVPPVAVGGTDPIISENGDIDNIRGLTAVPSNRTLLVFGLSAVASFQYDSICPGDCNDGGVCVLGACVCDSLHRGAACDLLSCALNCSYPQGLCLSDGQCSCNPEWQGNNNCSERSCPNNCNGHGTCSGYPNYICTCVDSWSGADCTIPPPPPPPSPCSEFKTYQQCVSYEYCGWCGDLRVGTCQYGDLRGPVVHACDAWWYDQEPEIGVTILAIIFLCIIGIMFIIDIISAIRVDFARAKDLREEYQSGKARKPTVSEAAALWWRDQRSAKAYTYLEQFQFLTFFQHLALTYPSRILQFTRFVDWSNLGIPTPFMADNTIHPERRKLLGMVQYANGLEILPKDIYANNMFWFGIGLGGICVVYGLLIAILYKKIHWRVVLTCRLTYIIVRFLNLAYFGLCVTTTYTLVAPPHDYRTIVPAVFTLIIMGIGWPIGVYMLVNGRTKQLLLDNEFRFKFGALYVSYKPERKTFYIRNLLRKFFTGIFIGFLSYSPENRPQYVVLIQALLLVIIQILYAIELFRCKPYYDHFHEYLEYFLVIVNIATIALSMLHYNKPLVAGELIIGLVQVLGLVACIGCYIVSWMQMSPWNLRTIFYCCKPKDNNIPLEGVSLSES